MDPAASNNVPADPAVEAAEVPPTRVEFHVPLATFVKVFAAILMGMAVYKLWPLLLLVTLAILLAVTLHSMVAWLMAHRLSHRMSLFIVIGSLLTIIGLGVAIVLPALAEQLGALSERLPTLRAELLGRFSKESQVRHALEAMFDNSGPTDLSAWSGKFLTMGSMAFTGISQLVLLLMIALYLVIDGGKTYRWLLAFFPPFTRRKMYHTAEETSQVIFGYVVGQAITSGLVLLYTFTVLTLLHVPAALMLAIVAALLDILPMLGFFLLTAPAVLSALTVSVRTALLVAALYLMYAAIENYFIVPRVYGKSLRLSPLSVLLGLLVGTILAGIPGAIAALPVVASYAVIERIWLKHYLGEGVSEKHELQKDKAFGEKT